jgi:hypothetical protein
MSDELIEIKVAEAEDIVLDWLVARCEGIPFETGNELATPAQLLGAWIRIWKAEGERYSTDWSHGGPILTTARISRTIDHSGLWVAYWTDGYTGGDEDKKWMHCHRNELVAGLRCYVESVLGKLVKVPRELLNATCPEGHCCNHDCNQGRDCPLREKGVTK